MFLEIGSAALLVIGSFEERTSFGAHSHALGIDAFALDDAARTDCNTPVVVVKRDAASRLAEILAIRRDARSALRPIFVCLDAGSDPIQTELTDGMVDSPQAAIDLGEPIAEILRALPNSKEKLDADRRLLHFLYARRDRRVMPVLDWTTDQSHRYPLPDALAEPDLEVSSWIDSLLSRDLLSAASIVTRLRHCPACGSTHINFVDRCTNCRSLEIAQLSFLHCFSCGNVAPMSKYSIAGRLQCPKCSVHLRQIGVDYDRAIESYACADCAATFSEPEIIGSCLKCGEETAPPLLITRDVRALHLSEHGRLATRSGSLAEVFAALDHLNYAVPEDFFRTLDWFLKLRRRYNALVFSIVGVRFANVPEVVAAVGELRTMKAVERIAIRLRELLRDTDESTRTSEDTLWMLLPFTDSEGNKIVQKKIAAILELTEFDGGRLDLRVAVLTGEDSLDQENGELLVARMSAMLESA